RVLAGSAGTAVRLHADLRPVGRSPRGAHELRPGRRGAHHRRAITGCPEGHAPDARSATLQRLLGVREHLSLRVRRLADGDQPAAVRRTAREAAAPVAARIMAHGVLHYAWRPRP